MGAVARPQMDWGSDPRMWFPGMGGELVILRIRHPQAKLTVNLDAKTVDADGSRVHLTAKEYQVLELLSLRKGTTLTKEMFLNHLYGGMDEPELQIIDVFICKRRKKLAVACEGEQDIETVWGRGYILRDPKEKAAVVP
jgi:two-component system, cell cycle response regulator CtrA